MWERFNRGSMSDIVTFGETMLRLSSPTGTRLERIDTLDVQVGGAESNVAAAAASLGLEAVWLSKLPASPLGRRVVRELRGFGVHTGVAWDSGDDARLGLYYLEQGQAPRGTTVLYDRAESSFTDVTADELPTGVVRDTTYFHTSGITPALSDPAAETAATLLEIAQSAGATTTFDLNYRAKLWPPEEAAAVYERFFPRIDILFVPHRDAERVLDCEGDAVDVAHSLATGYEFETVVITRGAEGALALSDGAVHEQASYEAETLDAVGSGDAFVGGYLARRVQDGSVPEALAWGAATAALKRTISGDIAFVTPEDIRTVVEQADDEIDR